MRKKWYLETWLIALLFSAWFFIIPAIIGLVLLILQYTERDKILKLYGQYDTVVENISKLEKEFVSKNAFLDGEYQQKKKNLYNEYQVFNNSLSEKEKELKSLSKEILIAHYNFSDYDAISSEECKNQLSIIRNSEKEIIGNNSAFTILSNRAKKEINDNMKQILRCFNSECDNILINLSNKNIDSMRKKITTSYESLNKIFSVDGVRLNQNLLKLKLEELSLVYTFELKKQQEREQQKAIKEQMIEEEKVRKEIEKEKAKIEKDQTQCSNEINRLIKYLQKTQNDVEKQLYIDKIRELEDKIKELNEQKNIITEREANAKAGYVYIISNIGSFGNDIYKIGMTRRLQPMDRVKELSSASVPFEFDVHAMIFSDDAPALENALHKSFEKKSVNRVNLRKEFFKVTLDEIEEFVTNNFNNTVSFIRLPQAKEYYQTLEIVNSEHAS